MRSDMKGLMIATIGGIVIGVTTRVSFDWDVTMWEFWVFAIPVVVLWGTGSMIVFGKGE